jgi:hypothetical protein
MYAKHLEGSRAPPEPLSRFAHDGAFHLRLLYHSTFGFRCLVFGVVDTRGVIINVKYCDDAGAECLEGIKNSDPLGKLLYVSVRVTLITFQMHGEPPLP